MSSCCEHKAVEPAEHAHESAPAQCTEGRDCCAPPLVELGALAAHASTTEGIRTSIRIMQMDCPTEEALIRKKLGAMTSVRDMEFNLIQRVLTVEHAPNALEPVMDAIRSLGFEPELPLAGKPAPSEAEAPPQPWLPLALAGVAALASELADWMSLPGTVPAVLAIIAIVVCGLGTYKKGWIAIRNGNLNINALMSIAVTGALVLGEWPEAAMVMVLFTIAELIEARSLDRARNAIKGLLQLTPDTVTVQQADGSWQQMAASAAAVGCVVRVRPGERIGLDGEIVSGRSTVNQAPITGESMPVDKSVGDSVFAGTINESGAFEYQVSTAAGNTTLARIIHAVEEAQSARAPTQRFVDRFARIYTPIVFAIAVAVAILPPLLMGGSWYDWLYKALVMLVIACPCALVISTPVTIVSGLAAAARHGILIKGGVYLEEGRKLKWLALDKTGTLTHGKPQQTDFECIGVLENERCRRLAASLAARSDHPVSQALDKAAVADGIELMEVQSFEALPGRGVGGVIDGTRYVLGNHRLVHDLGRCSPALEARIETLERAGKSVVALLDERQVLALLAVADTVKASSRAAVDALHQLGVKTVMLTGDNPHTASAIAQQVGIDEVRGNQLPADKLKAIEALAARGTVGMVGDGINDAPALARADIGFAMGAMGTDTAIETADVALMDDNLSKIAIFVRLSQSTHTLLVQNIALALGIKAVFLALTVVGMSTMWMAVFADMGASLLVVGNGLRLLRK
ncbi:MAG: heavy metal translocating P-type ATPase [Azoarcus sp.]|nr:heavy metal translocating P-type ATPase [Azoarcus sp.]